MEIKFYLPLPNDELITAVILWFIFGLMVSLFMAIPRESKIRFSAFSAVDCLWLIPLTAMLWPLFFFDWRMRN